MTRLGMFLVATAFSAMAMQNVEVYADGTPKVAAAVAKATTSKVQAVGSHSKAVLSAQDWYRLRMPMRTAAALEQAQHHSESKQSVEIADRLISAEKLVSRSDKGQ